MGPMKDQSYIWAEPVPHDLRDGYGDHEIRCVDGSWSWWGRPWSRHEDDLLRPSQQRRPAHPEEVIAVLVRRLERTEDYLERSAQDRAVGSLVRKLRANVEEIWSGEFPSDVLAAL